MKSVRQPWLRLETSEFSDSDLVDNDINKRFCRSLYQPVSKSSESELLSSCVSGTTTLEVLALGLLPWLAALRLVTFPSSTGKAESCIHPNGSDREAIVGTEEGEMK